MTGHPDWGSIDDYLGGRLLPADPILAAALEASAAAGLPAIAVSPLQGRLLCILARACRAARILEIGTLGGYSTLWLAQAVPPDGQLVSLELVPAHAAVARANLARAGHQPPRVVVREGPAEDSLRSLHAEGAAPFDFIFIDADKPGYTEYLRLVLRLSRPGTLIVADNVVREGEVANDATNDPNALGIRRFLAAVAGEPKLTATAVQTVGAKGHDGLAVILVEG
jgi:predicted O-methyltransferase YrrM